MCKVVNLHVEGGVVVAQRPGGPADLHPLLVRHPDPPAALREAHRPPVPVVVRGHPDLNDFFHRLDGRAATIVPTMNPDEHDVSAEQAVLARQHMLRAQMMSLGMRAAYELHKQAFDRRLREGTIDAPTHTGALQELRAVTLDTLINDKGDEDSGVFELLGVTAAGEPDTKRGALGYVGLAVVGGAYSFEAQKARIQELTGREFPGGKLPEDLQKSLSFLLGSAVMTYNFVANHEKNKLLMEKVHTVVVNRKSQLAVPPAVTDPETSTVVVDGSPGAQRIGIMVFTVEELRERNSASASR